MRAIAPFETGIRGGSKASALSRCAVRKTSASNALNREKQDTDDKREKPPAPVRVELVCRDDTQHFDPFWDAPRLLPTFVTQMLGQAMPERRESTPVETAYGRAAAPRTALLLDRKS
jgi:hypothetical protein